MRRITFMMKTTMALGMLLLGCTLAQAQARTWVSGTGNDMDPCSRTAPCKTFAGALSKTSAGGQINVIDAGAYGPVTITKAITIDASESFAGILGTGTNGIVVNAGDKDVVVIRGLTIDGNESGLDGITFIAGGKLHVEDCRITHFSQRGINFAPTDKSELFVKDTIIRDNVQAGILVQPTTGAATVSIEHTRLEGNANGLSVVDSAQVTVRDSIMANNVTNGVLALATNASNEIVMESCVTTNNVNGIKASGSGANTATVQISNVTVTHNGTGLLTAAGGSILSYTNNTIGANKTDGAPDKQFPQQ
ncbi:MAG TPA: right-handed parallel beta-helix repeat-containing protein [Pyrinomonadaceae bacterium]